MIQEENDIPKSLGLYSIGFILLMLALLACGTKAKIAEVARTATMIDVKPVQ